MIKNYLRISAVAVFLLFIRDIIIFRQLFDAIFWTFLGLSILFSLQAFLPNHIPAGARKALPYLLLPVSIFSNVLFLFFILILALNYPPTTHFKAQLELRQPASEKVEARADLINLLQEVQQDCFLLPDGFDWDNNRFDHTRPGLGPLFSESCGEERQRLLDFITANEIALPYKDYKGELVLPVETE